MLVALTPAARGRQAARWRIRADFHWEFLHEGQLDSVYGPGSL
jgi:hypothetical protein